MQRFPGEVKCFVEKRTRSEISKDTLSDRKTVIDIHRPEKIPRFFLEFIVTMAATCIHFWKADIEEDIAVPEYFSFVTIWTFIF